MTTNSYNIRLAAEEDLPQLLHLMELGLGSAPSKLRSVDFWQWKHITQPFGSSIVFVAEVDSQIVGLRAFMRWAFSGLGLDGQEKHWRAVRAVDTVTHPDYRRLGIFRRLNEVAIEAAKENGIDFIFNTPNAQSGAGYIKQGWQEVGSLPFFFAINSWRDSINMGLNFILKKERKAEGQWVPTTLKRITEEDEDLFVTLANQAKSISHQLRTLSSPEYFRWRYAQHPHVTYYQLSFDRSDSCLVVRPNIRFGVKELVLCEIPESLSHNLAYNDIRKLLRKSGTSYSIAHSTSYHSNQEIIRKAGFFRGLKQIGMTLVFYPLSTGATKADLSSLDKWDFNMGALEVF